MSLSMLTPTRTGKSLRTSGFLGTLWDSNRQGRGDLVRRYKGKYYSAKRRAVYAQGDQIDALVLFDKYNWICNICSEVIDKALRFPHRRAATIEHVVPLCRGGTHTWDNVRP